jgi:hypothetical protein
LVRSWRHCKLQTFLHCGQNFAVYSGDGPPCVNHYNALGFTFSDGQIRGAHPLEKPAVLLLKARLVRSVAIPLLGAVASASARHARRYVRIHQYGQLWLQATAEAVM